MPNIGNSIYHDVIVLFGSDEIIKFCHLSFERPGISMMFLKWLSVI